MRWLPKITVANFNLRTTILAAALVWLSLVVFERSKFGDILENEIAVGGSYQMRSWLGKNPKLSPKLKVFFFDDKTFAALGKPDLSTAEWAAIFKSLDARKPRAILIDKIFSFPGGDVLDLLSKRDDIQTKIYTAGFSTSVNITGRSEVKNIGEAGYREPIFREVSFEQKQATPFIYGASKQLRRFFDGAGHVQYMNQSHIPGYIKAGRKTIFPHLSSAVSDSYDVKENSITVNTKKVNLDSRGRMLVNHGTKESLAASSFGMTPLYLRATRSKKPISVVNEGDTVLILPAMYTGGSDWHATLLGSMPGGVIIAGMVNSVLTGKHINKWDTGRPFFVLVGILLGLWLGLIASGGFFWFGLFIVFGCVPLAGMLIFTYYSLSIPWFYPLISFGVTSLFAMGQRTSSLRVQKIRMESELETARTVQKHFIKDGEYVGKHFKSYGLFLGASECSGDWLFKISNDKYDFLFLGDVMGHGISAALVTSMASAIVRSELARGDVPLKQIATVLNQVMYATFAGKISMSLTAFSFCRDRKMVDILNAGHTFPVLIENGKAKTIRVTGSLLGVSEAVSFNTKTLEFYAGQRLFTYTDGLVESQDKAVSNIRTKKLFSLIEKYADSSLEDMSMELFRETSKILGRKQAPDDITMLCIDLDKSSSSQKVEKTAA